MQKSRESGHALSDSHSQSLGDMHVPFKQYTAASKADLIAIEASARIETAGAPDMREPLRSLLLVKTEYGRQLLRPGVCNYCKFCCRSGLLSLKDQPNRVPQPLRTCISAVSRRSHHCHRQISRLAPAPPAAVPHSPQFSFLHLLPARGELCSS